MSPVLLAAAAVFTNVQTGLGRQLPDLPTLSQVSCQIQETLNGSILFGIGINSDAGLTGTIIQIDQATYDVEEEEVYETIDTVCPCFFSVLQQWWRNLMTSHSARTDKELDGLSCPYLLQKTTEDKHALAILPPVTEISVLDNLDKLEQARQLYALAEYYRLAGNRITARYYYQMVRDQCPGSRYDQMAAQHMEEIQPSKATETTDSAPAGQQASPRPTLGQRLMELWKQSETRRRVEMDNEHLWILDDEARPLPEPVHGGIQERFVQADLAPIDPALVSALERLLAESGDPEMPKLVLQAEPATGPEEQQELDPELGWLPPAAEETAPTLALSLEEPMESSEGEEADDESEDQVIPEFVPDWNQVIRDVMEAFGTGTCVEIDGSKLGRLRFLCQKQVGAVTVRIFSDGDGVFRCVVASLDPESIPDLRTTQRAFNDRIGRWIEALSAGAEETDDEVWIDDDPDQDDDEGIGLTF
jgi:hypothetical protein